MEVCIRRAKPGDEETLAMIQIKSWQSAFADILDRETLEGCTDFERVTATYRRLLEQGIGNGYLLTVDGSRTALRGGTEAAHSRWQSMPS